MSVAGTRFNAQPSGYGGQADAGHGDRCSTEMAISWQAGWLHTGVGVFNLGV